ncbi:retrovirus-related pol polyprotein from transposon TNT 1-94, partial [Tanacetum coccineum]
LEAIRIFLAFATYMNFTIYQMDVKSAFLNENLKEEVYVKQPPGFKSSEFPNHVCKLDKALYGLKQSPRAWYETLQPFSLNTSFDLKGYSDFDYAGCNMDRKSTSGACQLLGGKLVCWSAKKQQSVAMSLAEAEYVAGVGCCANILWMKIMHSITKHIDIRYHFIRDHILKGDIELHFIPTQYQVADIFTKPLDEPTFKRLICELGYSGEIEAKGTLRKGFLPPRWRLLIGQIIQCLGEIDFAKLIWEDFLSKLNKKFRKKVVPYPMFLSMLLQHKMEGYGNDKVTLNLTQDFSAHNWALKKNQPEGSPFTKQMLDICKADALVAFKLPKSSSKAEKKVTQGTKPGATSG